MLKGIDPVLTPELLKALQEMGHADTVALVDRNYPATTSGRPVIQLGEISAERAARALFSVFPLDTFIDQPLGRMESAPGDQPNHVHQSVLAIAAEDHPKPLDYELIERHDFYERARQCHVIIQCLETAPYSCFIAQKGVV